MRLGIAAALNCEAGKHIVQVSAGNYGGQLGQYLLDLRKL
jgi:formylmethanofuran:tetrahydromethanopterin formyltransferase